MDYSYPLNEDWSIEEMIEVVAFFNAIEKAYEEGITKEELFGHYHAFKQIVRSKMEEKQLDQAFESLSGYSIYQTLQAAKDLEYIKMKVKK